MTGRETDSAGPLVEPLTRRERQVLALLAEGYSGPEIAEKLTLALSSAKLHIQNIYGKLGANTKRQAITRAGELGLLGAAAPGGLPRRSHRRRTRKPGPSPAKPLMDAWQSRPGSSTWAALLSTTRAAFTSSKQKTICIPLQTATTVFARWTRLELLRPC